MTDSAPIKLDELYQEVILDHNKKPRNFKRLDAPTAYAHGVNPLCGDDYELFLKIGSDGKVTEVGFQGSGCAISKSSASLMTTMIEGKSVEEAKRLQGHFVDLLTRDKMSLSDREGVGRLKLFEGVRQFPVRVKCATLIWRTLEAALKQPGAQVTTETDEDRKREAS
jgi:nitrogen fixation NifU-like protein